MNAAPPRGLDGLELTYDLVGVTVEDDRWRLDPLPGFRASETGTRIGAGQEVWDTASGALLRWAVKTRSGFTVDGADEPGPVQVNDRHAIRAKLGPFGITEPVQVVAVVDQPERRGFAYGTLAGHPLSGEEAFLLDREQDDSIVLTIRSLSRPAPGLRRALWPAIVIARPFYLRRYERALRGRPA